MDEFDDSEAKRKAFAQMEAKRKQSLFMTPGKEGKFVAKGSYVGTAIAIFTSGGDAQGKTIFRTFLEIAWSGCSLWLRTPALYMQRFFHSTLLRYLFRPA